LDIGVTNGELTIPVSQSFRETTVVEPNEKQVAFLKRRCPHFTIYNDLWKKIDLGSSCYDFILCSHVLYYIEEGIHGISLQIVKFFLIDVFPSQSPFCSLDKRIVSL
jgi:16S rRNA A1518/A1519 N6-dimethyltransferase RsmA/KsgA/DIM1 with predicted DNA glycosylase/AP lyase activity